MSRAGEGAERATRVPSLWVGPGRGRAVREWGIWRDGSKSEQSSGRPGLEERVGGAEVESHAALLAWRPRPGMLKLRAAFGVLEPKSFPDPASNH